MTMNDFLNYQIGDLIRWNGAIYFIESYNGDFFKASPIDGDLDDLIINKAIITEIEGVPIEAKFLYSVGFSGFGKKGIFEDDMMYHALIEKAICPETNEHFKSVALYWDVDNGFAIQCSSVHILEHDNSDGDLATVFLSQIKYVHQVQNIMRAFDIENSYLFDIYKYQEFDKR